MSIPPLEVLSTLIFPHITHRNDILAIRATCKAFRDAMDDGQMERLRCFSLIPYAKACDQIIRKITKGEDCIVSEERSRVPSDKKITRAFINQFLDRVEKAPKTELPNIFEDFQEFLFYAVSDCTQVRDLAEIVFIYPFKTTDRIERLFPFKNIIEEAGRRERGGVFSIVGRWTLDEEGPKTLVWWYSKRCENWVDHHHPIFGSQFIQGYVPFEFFHGKKTGDQMEMEIIDYNQTGQKTFKVSMQIGQHRYNNDSFEGYVVHGGVKSENQAVIDAARSYAESIGQPSLAFERNVTTFNPLRTGR